MPIYTLDDLRRVANSAGVSGSDEFLIKDYASRSGMDPAHVANRLGYDGGTSTLTRERLSGAVDNYQSGLYETGAAVAGALGLEGARKFAERKAADNRFQADVAGARAKQLGGVDSYEDVDGVSSGLNYLGGLAAQSLPYAAEALVGGFAGRIGATGLKAAALAGRTAGATEEAVRAGTAAQRALDLRSMGGATVASYPSSMGDVLGNQREQIETSGGEMDYGSAAVGAVPYSLLNGALGINSLAARGRLARVGTDMLDGMQGFKGGAARMGATVGKTMLEEGSSELGQEGVNQYFGRMAVDPNEEFLTDGSRKRFAESFVGGAALGGAFGSIGGHRRSEGYKPTNTNVPDPDQTTPREWTTSQGFENLQRETPQFDGETPDWALSQGFEGVTAIPRGFDLLNGRRPTGTQIPAVDASGLYGDHNEQLPLNNVKLANDLGVPNIPPVRNTMDDGASLDFTPTTAYAAGDGEVSGMGGIGGRPGQGSYMSEEDMLNDPGAAVARAAQMKEQQRLAEIKKTALAHAEKVKVQEAAAKEFGINGTKGVGLFVELNELHQAGKITDGELAENIGLLGAKHNGSVEKWIKGQAIVKQTLADANKADKEAVMTALTKKGAKNVSTAPTAGAVAGNAGQQPSSVNAGSQSVSGSQPVGGTGGGSVPAARADGASKTSVAVQPASVSPAPVVPEKSPGQRLVEGLEAHTGKRFTPKDKSRLFLTAGLDKDGYPSGPKLTYDQAASVEAALSGKGKAISREGFSKNLRALGVTDDLVHRFADRLEQQDLEVADSDVVQENTDGTLAADSQEEFDSPKTADEIEMNVIEDPDVPRKQGQAKGAEVVRAVGESTGFSVKTGANSGGDGGTAKRIVESLLDLLDAKTPVTKTGGGEPILNDTQRNEVYRVLAAGSGLVSDESPKPNMSRKELSDKAKAKSIEAAHRVIERAGQLLTRTDVFSPHMIDMLNELVGGTKAKNVEDAKRNIVAEAIRANAGPTPEQLAQIAKNKAIVAENERLLAEMNAEVEDAVALRDLLDPKIGSYTIADAAKEWNSDRQSGDTAWERLTPHEQARWIDVWVAYETGELDARGLNREYGQQLDSTRRTVGQGKDGQVGTDSGVGAGRDGGKVSESGASGSVGQDMRVGPSSAGEEGSAAEAPQKAVTPPTITVKKKRTILKDDALKVVLHAMEGDGSATKIDIELTSVGHLVQYHRGIRRAVSRYVTEGIEHVLEAVDHWGMTYTDFGGAGAFAQPGDESVLFYSAESVGNDAEMEHITHHELGHAIDLNGRERGGVFSGLPEFNLRLDRSGAVRPMHAMMRDVVDFYNSPVDSELAEMLSYPLDTATHPGMDAQRIREELFAQLWAAYNNDTLRDELYDKLPAVAYFMEDVHDTVSKTDYGPKTRASSPNGSVDSQGAKQPEQELHQRVSKSRGGASAAEAGIHRAVSQSLKATATRLGGSTGAMLYEDAAHQATKAVRSLAFLHDLVDEYKDRMPSVREWYRSMQATVSARMEMEEPAERIAAEALKLKDGAGKVNALVAKATTQQKWPYDPKIAGRPVTPDPVLAQEFKALTKDEQKVVQDIFAHGEHMRQYEQDLMTRLDLGGILTAYTKLDGPYAPLKRFGNYIAILKSQELRDAEQNDDKKKVEELKKDPKHYTVSFFDTKGLAMEFANINDKANGGAYDFSTYGEKDVRVGEEMPTDHAVIQRVLGAIKGGDLDPKAKEAATNLIRDMYFQSIDEHHARVHGLKRKNIAGYSEDMVRAFLHHARAQANFLANLEHGGETNEQFYAMKKEARKSANDKLDNQDIVNTFAAHYEESLKYKETPIQDRMMALTSAWQLATSVGYHLANFMQPVMATLPKLASDFNDYSGAWKHLLDAYGTLKTTGIRGHLSLDGIRDEGLQATLQRAVELQLMDMGMDSDISSFEATHTGIAPVDAASRGVKKALHNLRQVSRAVETANRVSSAVAAYNMAIQKGKTPAQAQDYAINILQTTQGDSTRMGAPLLLKRLPKIMTQYKKFQFMMAAMYVKAFRQAFKGATAEERAIGRRMLAYKLFHTSMAAGVMGMPLMNLVQIVFNMLGADGDEPPDFERWLKEQGAPDALLHGPLSFMGTDAKLGEEKVFSILPYADWDITSATGVKNMVAGLLGPAVSQGLKVADGIGAIKNGDYYKGVEKMMPSGVANGMKAFRVANDGYTLKNGDVMFKPDDINGAVLALDALGLPSSQMKNMEWLRSQQYQIGKFYNDRSKAIERDYLKAFKDGDTDAMMEARESWMSLQAGKDEMRHWFGDSSDELKRQPLSTLLKYPQTVSKRESKLQKGALVE